MGTAKGEKTVVAHNKVVIERYRVKLIGETPMVFQRYIDNQEHPPQELLYLDEHGDLYIPGGNILGFFTNATSGTGCAATFGAKGSKGELIRLAQSYLTVQPDIIPFLRNGNRIRFGGFAQGATVDHESGIRVLTNTAWVHKGKERIPQARRRPVLDLPWTLEFELHLIPFGQLSFNLIDGWMERGGREICLGAFRPFYGKFHHEVVAITN